MKTILYIMAGGLLGVAVVWLLIRGSDSDPAEALSDPAVAATDTPPQAPPRPSPGSGAAPSPGALPGGVPRGLPQPVSPEKVFADFIEEEGLTEGEAEDLFAALKKSDQELFGMFEQSRTMGELDGKPPVMPMLEEIEGHRVAREAVLLDILGEERYQSFNAYTATLPLRGAMKGLRSKGVKLAPGEMKSILNGAFEAAREGTHASPQAYQQALVDEVVALSGEHLEDAQLGQLEKALNQNSLMPPALPPIPMPTALPGSDLPALPPGVPPPPGLPQPQP